mmetsp:Transcript_102846/g.165700  ORF Transcript_102846/g.165700 Transcript_102846/m.165700 type:complete len:82 (+) Transcript_102846:1651-1896(+)
MGFCDPQSAGPLIRPLLRVAARDELPLAVRKKRNTPRSQEFLPEKEVRKGTNRETHSEGPCQGETDRIQTHESGEGGNGEK